MFQGLKPLYSQLLEFWWYTLLNSSEGLRAMAKQVSLEQIVQCGVNQTIAAGILSQINHCLASLSPVDCWQYFSREILKPHHPFPLHELLYQTAFSDWDSSQGSPAVWLPSDEQIKTTNITALMKELKIVSYEELHAWSVQNRAEFWEVTIRRLNICLSQKYTQIVDLSPGIESPQWLVGARLNIVESCFQASTEEVAIIWQQEGGSLSTLSYGELEALTNRVANSLLDFGCSFGDRLAIAMPMTTESVAIYLGIIKAGCVVVSIPDSLAAEEIATRLHLSQAKAIFTQDYIWRAGKQLPLYTKVIDANPLKAIVLASNSSLSLTLRQQDLSWNEFLSPQEKFDAIAVHPEAYTNILFSSGTTGEPKAIPWTQTTPIKCAVDGHLHHDIHPGEIVAWPTNLGWMMGPWLIYASLINRATIALYYGTPAERGFGQFVQDGQVNMLGVVPSLVSTWKVTGCMQGLDWSAIKAFSSTGECSTPQDMLFLMSLAEYKPVIEYCGGTEIGGGYITGTLVQPCAPSTFTTPALGLDLAIFDENGHFADQGEAFIIPPSVGLSIELLNKNHHQVYFANTPSLPSVSIPLRRHGDRLERLPNSYYRAQGRADDTMNLGGIKVSSAEIERVLNAVEGVYETAAIAVSLPQGGMSQLVIYAVVAPQVQTDKDSLMAAMQTTIKQHLNPLFKIAELEIVRSLPRTASNKVMRRVLRDQYHVKLC
ncbi:MAG: AMP-binding protein [Pleurocapsa sp. MO_192.B19]|nr:AMP-binding protein [Pleurocapsa sp. MO_192.B19]